MTKSRIISVLGILSFVLMLVAVPASVKAQSIPVWQPGVAYTVGQEVSYNGIDYTCLQSHTSEVGWEPPTTPALWSPVSSGSSQCTTVPSAPTGLAASSTSSSGTTLSWGAVTAPANCTITSYTVLQNGSSIGTTTGTSLSVTGLAASTTYSFTVEATDGDGTSSPSTALSVTTSAGSSSGSCAAAWNATTAYTGGMTASENGENYLANWWTQGQNPATNSGPSGSGEPWTAQGACSSCSQAPPTPTGLAATATYDSANLSWSAVTPPASCTVSYTVQVSGQSSVNTASTSETVSGLAASTAYTYSVAATDSAGSSAAATSSFTTQANPCTAAPASAPANLTSANTTGSTTALSWSSVTAPANCTISYTITGGPATLTTSNTTDTVTGLTPSTSYSFEVAATDHAGSGPASTITVKTTNTSASAPFVGGWFEEWGTYYANSNVADLQNSGVVNSLTHVIYAFAKPASNGTNVVCQLADPYADYQKAVPQVPGATAATSPLLGNFGALEQLKQLHPNLKILISIGGWNPPTYNEAFDTASSTEANRQAFVSSCVSMFIQGNLASGVTATNLFDGFDIDWEFPNAAETNNFTALLTEFRTELNTLSASTGKTYQVLADLAAGPSTPGAAEFSGNDGGYDTINIAAVSQELDYLNVDGYNYAGDWSNATNDASALYDEGQDPLYGTSSSKGCNYIDCTVQYYLSQGAPAAKYTMGFPLYGVGWAGGLTSANSGMYQNATGVTDGTGVLTTNGTTPVPLTNGTGLCSTGENQSGPAAGCDPLLTDGMATYGTLVNMLNHGGYTVSFDSTRCATRMFDASTSPFTDWAYSYDNANSVQCKVNYIKQYGLGGGYVWALKDDDASGDLTKTLSTDLNQ